MGFYNKQTVKDEMGLVVDDRNISLINSSQEGHIKSINNVIKSLKDKGCIDSAGEISDGYHTFNSLYNDRAFLFSSICNLLPSLAWKSKVHEDGTMFDGMFIVGLETTEGNATYHYDIDTYWDIFDVKELEKAPAFDGHTTEIALERILNECRWRRELLTL